MATRAADGEAPELLDPERDPDRQFSEAIDVMRSEKRPRVRVRVLVQLYRFGKGQRYKNWKGVLWRLDLEPTVLAGSNFRAALSTFFDAVATVGPARVVEALKRTMQGEG